MDHFLKFYFTRLVQRILNIVMCKNFSYAGRKAEHFDVWEVFLCVIVYRGWKLLNVVGFFAHHAYKSCFITEDSTEQDKCEWRIQWEV